MPEVRDRKINGQVRMLRKGFGDNAFILLIELIVATQETSEIQRWRP